MLPPTTDHYCYETPLPRKSLFVVTAAAVAVVVGALSCSYCSIINLSPRFIAQQLLSVKRLMSHEREEQSKQTNK